MDDIFLLPRNDHLILRSACKARLERWAINDILRDGGVAASSG
jgi:hypothetical protein